MRVKRIIDVHKGEIMAGQGEVVLESDSNGACLVILAYDSVKKIGGLAHALFLKGNLGKEWHSSVLPDADKAIDEMIQDMSLMGAQKDNIEVCLVTGENVPHEKDDEMYQRNLDSTIDLLKSKHIKFRDNSIQDAGQQHVGLDVESGKVFYY